MNTNSKYSDEAGFGLIEALFAMIIFVTGTLAVLGLIAEGIKFQMAARTSTEALSAARSTAERVGARPRAMRPVGGSLTANATGYSESVSSGGGAVYNTRWTIEERDAAIPATADIPGGLQRMTVQVTRNLAGTRVNPVVVRTYLK